MALTDPLGLQEDPEKEQQIPDYLGKESPLAFKGQPALPVTGAAAFGSPNAPAGPGGPGPMPEGMTEGMTGGTQGGYAQLAAKLMGMFGGGDLGTRGETGGVSLSDELRSRGMGEFGAGAGVAAGAAGLEGLGEGFLSGFGDLGGAGSLGAESLSGLMGSAPFGDAAGMATEGLLEAFQAGGWEGLLGNMNFGGLDPFSSWATIGMIKSMFGDEDAFRFPFGISPSQDRGPSVAKEIRTQMRDLPVIFNQLEAGAVDPKTFAGMNDEDLAKAFTQARIGYGASNGLAPVFGASGRKEAGVQHPDLSGLVGISNDLQGRDFFNMVAAQDMLNQRGYQWPSGDPDQQGYDPYNQPLDFGTALQVTAGGAGVPKYDRELTALAPWMPLYKDSPYEVEFDPNAGGDVRRTVAGPAEYLSAIGADPKLAETLGPLIEGAQPGQYMDTLEKIYGLLNPNLGDSMFGQLRASMAGGGGGGEVGAEASRGGGGFGDVASQIFAPGQPPPFDPNDAGQAGLGGGEQFAAQQLGVEVPEGVE